MRIDIDKSGNETVTLTKAEQQTLDRASLLCQALGRRCESPTATEAHESLRDVIASFCVTDNAEEAVPMKQEPQKKAAG